jgi:hypothetical protein|tara:strand:+ start:1560 stop:2357 length:798 start_codon:yes stop_codon:yes gene_type:complete
LKKAFYSSLFIHGLIFVFIFITLPKIKIKEIDYISVEIINEGVKKEVEKKVVKEIKANKKTAIKVAPPKQKPKSAPKINEAVEIIKKTNIKPKPPQKKPKEKKVEKPKEKNDDNLFDDMLKNLAENQPEPIKPINKPIKPIKEMIKKPQPQKKKSKEEIKNIKRSIANTIWKQIRENYTIPPAPDLKLVKDIGVQIRIYVRPDGTINKTVIDKSSLKKAQDDPTYLPYVEAAQRAIKRLGKFDKLPQEEYNSWKIIDIRFTPYKT